MKKRFIKIYKCWKTDREDFFLNLILGFLIFTVAMTVLFAIGIGIYSGYREEPTITMFVLGGIFLFVLVVVGSILLGKHFLAKEET